ncbi:MAG: DUF5777 family beta-barrel protein [Thermoanaerobaculia bacterium]
MRRKLLLFALLGLTAAGPSARAQQTPPPEAPAGKEPEREAVQYRPLEGPVIINLPSVDVPQAGTLTLFFTHRFRTPVQDADWFHDLVSFDLGADIGIGLSYAPSPNLDVSFYRSSSLDLDPWELAAKYRLVSKGPLGVSLRVGGDVRSEDGLTDRWSFFTQAILAYSIGERVRVTAVPTYVSQISGRPFAYFPPQSPPPPNDRSCESTEFESFLCHGLYENAFNVPVAVSVALTRSISLHAEVTARYGKADSIGVGWVASIEKTLLRHRWCFTAGNQRQTTVDQYAASLPYWMRFDPIGPDGKAQGNRGIYLGFNIVRQWMLK